jgi:hypothetical protein
MTNAPTTIRHIRLEPLPDGFARGRQSLHQLAFFAIAPKRFQDTGRLGLRHTGTGFGTPGFDPGEQIRVEEDRIIRQRGEDILSARVTTLEKACEFLGIPYREQWFDRFHDPLAPVGADVPGSTSSRASPERSTHGRNSPGSPSKEPAAPWWSRR